MTPLQSLILSSLGTVATLLSGVAATTSDGGQQQQQQQQQQQPLANSADYTCQHPPYKVTMMSKSPLVIYISNFITADERAHLQTLTKDTFSRSGVADRGSLSGKALHQVRTSQSTNVPRDAVVRCIEDRALSFQGYDTPRTHLEPLQLVKYGPTERYHFHTDWFTDPAHAGAATGGNRVSSFFAYVHVANDTTGGGTNFPHLDAPASDGRWCDAGVVDCDEPWENGVTFRPVEGNALYWENLLPDGTGDERTLHAGLPVSGGGKIGMNIWTRQLPLSEDVRGPDL
ncbi:2OG-Fe(II) oxygenase superfamily protein [Podospora didyma]|uniref:2OG-Fe(II) oxygenase superfamily protein n=1 Tax=Podospora didyma TaxID=330526 RepID=A0AAE0NQD9_9PEZI|nr:2OG-Fe(II) oxygenase superfamily protein [Podospora didyma]